MSARPSPGKFECISRRRSAWCTKAELSDRADSETPRRLPHAENMYYIGLDVHKRTISYCVKDGSGTIHAEGTISATRFDLDRWMKTLPQPWAAAMEATVFTGWIYDHLQPHAAALKVAHPLMLRAIAAAKKKNDRIDASKICDCLRCDFLPECYMASTSIRARRRTLRDRNLLVRQMVQMKNKISGLLMEAGVSDPPAWHRSWTDYGPLSRKQTRKPFVFCHHLQRPLSLCSEVTDVRSSH